MTPPFPRAVATVCFVFGLSAAAAAQTSPTEVSGRVTGPSGSALAGVTVTADCARGQQPASTHTSKTGDYRFSPIQPGTCRLTFVLAGYRTVARDAVTVEGGSVVTMNVSLDAHTVLGATFTRDHFDDIPSARDVWAIMNQTPGVVMPGISVGGSGQQPTPDTRGQTANVTWMLDGASITDLAANSSPLYYDLGSLDSIHVTTGGGDVSQQTSGLAIHLTTRSGTNTTRGSLRGLFSNSLMVSNNITPALLAEGAGGGVPLNWYHEYGAEAGGPLRHDRMWWWAGSSVQDINSTVLGFYRSSCLPLGTTSVTLSQYQSCLAPDQTRLTNTSANVRMRPKESQSITVSAAWSDKTRNKGGAGSTTVSSIRQTGGAPSFAVRHAWTAGGHLVLDSQINYLGAGFTLVSQPSDMVSTIKRPSAEAQTAGTLTLLPRAGGEHALKFGVGYRRSPTSSDSHVGGNVVGLYSVPTSGSLPTPVSAVLYRDGIAAIRYDTTSAHLQDSWRLKRLALTGGARWDLQRGYFSAVSLPANPLAPLLLPAATFPGAAPHDAYGNIAPRISAAYDITGKGNTLVSGSYGVYFGRGFKPADSSTFTGRVTATVPWSDSNGNGTVEANEILLSAPVFSTPLNPATGLPYPTVAAVDPHLQNSRTRESIVSVDRPLARDLSASASYIYRIYDRYTSGTTNQAGRSTTYRGLDVAVRKRFGNRWMLNAALTLQSAIGHWPAGSCGALTTGCAAGTVASDIDALNRRPADLFLPRYLAKLNGRVALPWGIGLSATANVQDGFIRNVVITAPSGPGTILVAPQGTTRYPAMTMIDAQFDKSVRLRGRASLRLSLVAFNLLNSAAVYSRASNQSQSSFGSVLAIVGPRALRFGVTAAF